MAAKFRVFHKEVGGFTHVGVEDENGYGAIAVLYPNSPHYVLGCQAFAQAHTTQQWGTPDLGSGMPHPEMSYDLWLEGVREHESIMGKESVRTPSELYVLWLIGQPPESVTDEE